MAVAATTFLLSLRLRIRFFCCAPMLALLPLSTAAHVVGTGLTAHSVGGGLSQHFTAAPMLALLPLSTAAHVVGTGRTTHSVGGGLSQHRLASPQMCAAAEDEQGGSWLESEDADVQEVDATLFKKRKGAYKPYQPKDDRDKLLYRVTEVTPPPRVLGNFRLGPSAGCGDLISARVRLDGESEKIEQAFVIKRVSYRYEFSGGRYKMAGKGAYVKQASRDAVETSLSRLLPEESAASDDVPDRSGR